MPAESSFSYPPPEGVNAFAVVDSIRTHRELVSTEALATLALVRDIIDSTLPKVDPTVTHERRGAAVNTDEHPIASERAGASGWSIEDQVLAERVRRHVVWVEGVLPARPGRAERIVLMPYYVIGTTEDRKEQGFSHLLVAPLGGNDELAASWGCRILTCTNTVVTARAARERRLMHTPFTAEEKRRLTDDNGRIVIDSSLPDSIIIVPEETDNYPNSNVVIHNESTGRLKGISRTNFERFEVAATLARLVAAFEGDEKMRILRRQRLGLGEQSEEIKEDTLSYEALFAAYKTLRKNHEQSLRTIISYMVDMQGATVAEATEVVNRRFSWPPKFE
jgi:hypothetical protein